MSYGMQSALAIIFWVVMFIDDTAIPSLVPAYRPTAVTNWLSQHQQTCLWTQLLFTLTLGFAALIRQWEQQQSGVYEGSGIVGSVIITVLNLVLTVVSVYRPIYRWILFALCFMATLACALAVKLRRPWTTRLSHVLQSCVDYAFEKNMPWRFGAIKPFYTSSVYRRFLDMGLVVLLLVLWLILWMAEHRPSISNHPVSQDTLLSLN